MSADTTETVTVPRAELDELRAEVRRLKRALDDEIAKARILAHRPGQPGERTFSSAEELAQSLGLRG